MKTNDTRKKRADFSLDDGVVIVAGVVFVVEVIVVVVSVDEVHVTFLLYVKLVEKTVLKLV